MSSSASESFMGAPGMEQETPLYTAALDVATGDTLRLCSGGSWKPRPTASLSPMGRARSSWSMPKWNACSAIPGRNCSADRSRWSYRTVSAASTTGTLPAIAPRPGSSDGGRRRDLWAPQGRGEFPAEISLGPLEMEQGMLILSTIRDITQQERERHVAQRKGNCERRGTSWKCGSSSGRRTWRVRTPSLGAGQGSGRKPPAAPRARSWPT